MSGLPLISIPYGDDNQWKISGILTAGARNFARTWFARPDFISRLIRADYNVSQLEEFEFNRPSSPAISWKMHFGVLYREGYINPFGMDKKDPNAKSKPLFFKEASFFNGADQPAVQRNEFGNGTRSDGGNGTRSDGGNGTRSDGGNTIFEQTHWENLVDSGVILSTKGLNSTEPQYNILNWIKNAFSKTSKNQPSQESPIIGIKTDHRLVSATTTSALWLANILQHSTETNRLGFESVYNSENFSEIVWQQLEKDFGRWIKRESNAAITIEMTANLLQGDANDLTNRTASVAFSYNHIHRHLSVKLLLDGDRIEFELGQFGELLGGENSPKQFHPEVVLESKQSQQKYLIDLSGLLMTSPDAFNIESQEYKFGTPNQGNIREFHIRSQQKEFILSSFYREG